MSDAFIVEVLPPIPDNIEVDHDGVFLIEQTQAGRKRTKISDPIFVTALTRNADNSEWGRVLRFFDLDGKEHELSVAMSMLSGDGRELRALLLSHGLYVHPSRKGREAFAAYILGSRPTHRIRSVRRVGWYDSAFVLPNETVGATGGEPIIFQSEGSVDHRYRTSGSFEEWKQQIGQKCVGNAGLIFAVSAAFAGPLLSLIKEAGGGFHFVSHSSTGKTTTLLVAGSVCGGGHPVLGFCDTWASTINAFEANAELQNNGLMCLDEIKQSKQHIVGEVAYMLANGQGKGRLTSSILLRPRFTWSLLFLSTGEISLRDLVEQANERYYGGQSVRICDIPAETNKFGVFEELHGAPTASEFANQLRDSALSYYGTPLRAWLTELVNCDKQIVQHRWNEFRDEFLGAVLPENASGEVVRAATRFSAVAFGGEVSRNITGWPENAARDAGMVMFRAWLDNRGEDTRHHDANAAVKQVRYFLEQYGTSRFQQMESSEARIYRQAGYWRFSRTRAKEYLISPEVFKREVCNGFDAKLVAKELADRGHLRTQAGRFDVVVRFPDRKGRRFYVVSENIFEGGDEPSSSVEQPLPF